MKMNAVVFVTSVLGILILAPSASATLALVKVKSGALDGERPVMKVVRLLQDMLTELGREGAEDNEIHESIGCWCEKNEDEKTAAIEEATNNIADLDAKHSESTAKISELRSMEATTRDKIIEDKHALDTAVALRMKESQAFQGEETDLIQAVKACKQALVVLSKHHPELAQLKTVAKTLRALKMMQARDALGRDKMAVLSAFLEEAEDESTSSLRRIPGFRSYVPQSGQIFGILKQMQEEFGKDLSQEQKNEAKAVEDFNALKIAKQEELEAGKAQLRQLQQDLAAFGETQIQAWEEMEAAKEQMKIDKEFLRNLLKRCAESEKEYEERKRSRNEEILAVQDTIGFLNSDHSFDNLEKTVNAGTSLLQLSWGGKRQIVAKLLRKAGAPQSVLSLLASNQKLDAFTKVKASIDTMVAELARQQTVEVEHRDWCITEMNENKRRTAAESDKKASLEAQSEDLIKVIESMSREIETKKKAVADMEAQMKAASETRQAENEEFQQVMADQQLTQSILQKAIDRMREVYALIQGPGAPQMQLSGNRTDAGSAPARFNKYQKNAGGARVVALLETVMKDAVKMMNEAQVAEMNAAGAYENFMTDSNRSIKQYNKGITTLSEDKATTEQSLGMAKSDLSTALKELEGLNNELGDFKMSCDFSLRNFEARQQARTTEMDALREAKAILSGMQ